MEILIVNLKTLWREKKVTVITVSFIILMLLALSYFYYQLKLREPFLPEKTYLSPFTDLDYPTYTFDKNLWENLESIKNVPSKLTIYSSQSEVLPLLTDQTAGEKFVQELGFTIEAKSSISGNVITQSENNQFLSIEKNGYAISFSTDLLQKAELLEAGNVPEAKEAQDQALAYLEQHKLIITSLKNSTQEIYYAQMTVSGLQETTNFNEAEVVMVKFIPQLNSYDYIQTTPFSQITFAKDQKVVAFYLSAPSFLASDKDLKIKSKQEILNSIYNNEGVYAKKCSDLENPQKITIKNFGIAYFQNPNQEIAQPILKFELEVQGQDSKCNAIMYLTALKKEYYQ